MNAALRLPALIEPPEKRKTALVGAICGRRVSRNGFNLSRNEAKAAYARARAIGAHAAPHALDRNA
ncbi:MAG: hypothetical protein R3C42_09245 [Parvularculaceae bacterium]|nr:hypothetical protein [Parvularculaceae bacterium]